MQHHLSETQWLIARLVCGSLISIAAFGAVSNLILCFVIFRTPSLRSSCHILIGLCALLDGIHQIGPLFQSPMLIGDGAIDNFTCDLLQFLPEMAVLGGCACTLSIGLERLTAVTAIAHYKRIGRKRYLMVHLLCISICSLYAVVLMTSSFQPGRQICSIPSTFHGAAAARWVQTICALNLATTVTYCIVAVAVSKKAGVSPAMRRAFRCIFIVMAVDVGGWTATVASLALTFSLNVTEETRLILLYVSGLFANFGVAAKAVIYYSISSEYRRAFQVVIGRFRGTVYPGNSSAVSTVTLQTF